MLRILLPIAVMANLAISGEARPAAIDGMSVKPETWRGAPGFWRVVQAADGRWWFIDPQGKRQFVRAVTSANTTNRSGGRRAPEGTYVKTVAERYGGDADAWAKAQAQRLAGWGFTAVGPWNHPTAWRGKGLAELDIVEFSYNAPNTRAHELHMADPFDPAWAAQAEAWVLKLCAPRRDDPTLLGWFLDNEMGWGPSRTPEEDAADTVMAAKFAPGDLTLLQKALMLPDGVGLREEAWRFCEQRHGGLAGVAKAWGVPLANRAAPRGWTKRGKRTTYAADGRRREEEADIPQRLSSRGFADDADAFLEHVTATYLERTLALMRKHAPNHLVLGVRFGGEPPEPVKRAFAKHPVDVLSFNSYFGPKTFAKRLDWYAQWQQPLFLGEFAWAMGGRFSGLDDKKWTEGRYTPQQVGEGVARAQTLLPAVLERYAAHPNLVGYAWYRFVDTGDALHTAPVRYGLVNVRDEPQQAAIAVLPAVNARLAGIHGGGALTTSLP